MVDSLRRWMSMLGVFRIVLSLPREHARKVLHRGYGMAVDLQTSVSRLGYFCYNLIISYPRGQFSGGQPSSRIIVFSLSRANAS